ncbi:MAG: HAMP domain-containing protein [Alphaproteobacteria bacterium]|nr:HAMP domain-containing protein [Alphaproteobacteria bacterium]
MRLTLRLSLLLAAVTAAVLMVLEVVVLMQESALLEQEHRAEAVLVAQSIATLTSHLSPREDEPLAALLASLSGEEVALAWRNPDALDAPPNLIGALEHGQSIVQLGRAASGPAVIAWAPVPGAAGPLRVVEVTRPLAGRDAFVRRSVTAALFSILIITLLTGVTALAAGQLMVGTRVDRLVEKTREVARGDLSHGVEVTGNDELTLLARALERMSTDLDRLQRLAAEEAQARLEAERALQHSDRLRTLGVLSAGVAHELGTPLNVISGRSRLIERKVDDPGVQADAATIREQVARISRIVRLMMAFARGAAPEVRRSDLAALVLNTAELLTTEARHRGVTLELDVPPEGMPVVLDPEQLTHVITNLTLNAVHVSPEGGRVRVCARPGPQGEATLCVEDQGPGVPPELRERIFEPFFTTKPPGEGTGLGLSIVRRVVQDHGGTLRVEDAEGGGARFLVILPQGAVS